MLYPLFATAFTAALVHILNQGFNIPDTLFEKHTTFIVAAFAFFFPVGLWFQKQRQFGHTRVWIHMLFSVLGVACVWVSGLAMWELKDEYKKSHLSTYHSWLGSGVAVLLTLQTVMGLLGPMAPWGSGKYSESDAKMHAQFGGLTYLMGVVTCFFGWFTSKANTDNLYTLNNGVFVGGFVLTMVAIAIATTHSMSYLANLKNKTKGN